MKLLDTLKALREKNADELREQIHQNNKDLYELRAKSAAGNVSGAHLVKRLNKDIARCNTLLTEKERAAGGNG